MALSDPKQAFVMSVFTILILAGPYFADAGLPNWVSLLLGFGALVAVNLKELWGASKATHAKDAEEIKP